MKCSNKAKTGKEKVARSSDSSRMVNGNDNNSHEGMNLAYIYTSNFHPCDAEELLSMLVISIRICENSITKCYRI